MNNQASEKKVSLHSSIKDDTDRKDVFFALVLLNYQTVKLTITLFKENTTAINFQLTFF